MKPVPSPCLCQAGSRPGLEHLVDQRERLGKRIVRPSHFRTRERSCLKLFQRARHGDLKQARQIMTTLLCLCRAGPRAGQPVVRSDRKSSGLGIAFDTA